MKRNTIIAVLLTLTLICMVIAGCGSDSKEASKPTIADSKALEPYIDIVKKESFVIQMKAQQKINDQVIDAVVTIAHKSKKYAVSILAGELNIAGVVKDEKVYSIIHSNKMVIVMPLQANKMNDYGIKNTFEEVKVKEHFVSSGNEEIKGKTYYYEEYKNSDNQDTSVKFYFENKKLKYIKQTDKDTKEDVLLEILEFSATVPDSLFDIPSDYQIREM